MNETVLSLSLLNDRLAAGAVHRGSTVGNFVRTTPVIENGDFAAAFREAIKQTGYAGTAGALVIAHQRLAQQLVETPPLKGQNLKWFLQKRVQQLKPFPAEAACSYQPTLPTRNGPALLLHLLPRPFLDQLVEAGERAELKLNRVIPATAVLQRQLAALPLAQDEVALLAAETGGSTTVVIGRKDGQIYLGRTLGNDWTSHVDRVSVDLNRTILYVKQQFGVAVGSVWLFGAAPDTALRSLQTTLRLPVKMSPVPPGPHYFNQEALKIPVDDPSNLISTEQLQAPRRRVLVRVTSVMVGLLAVLSLATAGGVQVVQMERARQLKAMETRMTQLQERRANLQQREREFLQQKEFVRVVSEERAQPVPGWLLGHLGNVLPEELFLSHYRVYRDADVWRLELGGALQPTTNPSPAMVLSQAVTALKKNLADGPFHVRFQAEGEKRNATNAPPSFAVIGPDQFLIQGVIKSKSTPNDR